QYREVRLAALLDSPDAFATVYEDAVARTNDQWQAFVRDKSPVFDRLLFVERAGVPGGLVWGHISPDSPDEAHVFQMWVDPSLRGQGAGKRLMDSVVSWARESGAGLVSLDVTLGNEPAIRLYLGAGFAFTGESRPLRPGSALRERSMVLALDGQGAPGPLRAG
ncbi:MAG: GNAT family N-acetyltransferase, partial [Pseudomonadales bacterium]|nr:GNAT family N-acetyltransferase [Pseudomonadales bacterium]